jgi:hypothetical protein
LGVLFGTSFLGCLYKVFKRSIRIDARTRLFGMIPVGSVFHKGRVKGPERARSRLDRVDDTLLILIEKGAVSARNASDMEPAMPLFTVESNKGLDGQAEEICNLLDFLRLKRNTSFAVAALSAFLALKSFHPQVPKVSKVG